MYLPHTYTTQNETGCCAIPNIQDWDEKQYEFENKQFIRMYTRSIFFVPLNMASVMTKIQKTASDAGAEMDPQDAMILSRDISPWKAEQLYAVSKPVDGADNVTLNGPITTKVFDGPFQNVKNWYTTLTDYVTSKGKTVDKVYFFYTTCPKCAKHYGKNYSIGIATTI